MVLKEDSFHCEVKKDNSIDEFVGLQHYVDFVGSGLHSGRASNLLRIDGKAWKVRQ